MQRPVLPGRQQIVKSFPKSLKRKGSEPDTDLPTNSPTEASGVWLEAWCYFTIGSNSFPEAVRSALQDCPNPGVGMTRGVTFPCMWQPCVASDAQHLIKSQLSSCSMQHSPLLSPTQLRAGFWDELLLSRACCCSGPAAVIVPCRPCDFCSPLTSSAGRLWGSGEQLGWLFSQRFQAAAW